MAKWREPGFINYERRAGGDPLLEPMDIHRGAGEQEYIMVCGMRTKTVWIKWYGRTAQHAREKFRVWLSEPWQVLTTDLSGYGAPNGFDFKPSGIEWFGVID